MRILTICLLPLAALTTIVSTATLGQRRPPAPAYTYPAPLQAELKQLAKAALESDYAYRQVAHLSNNIGPRLSGSAQAQQAVGYVAGGVRRPGFDVELGKAI